MINDFRINNQSTPLMSDTDVAPMLRLIRQIVRFLTRYLT
jgi:hypothetical protein